MKFVLQVRRGRPSAEEFAGSLTDAIREVAGSVVDHDGPKPDMVIAVGGDGTMLGAVRLALAHDVPVLGFNLGTVGFLAEAEPDQLKSAVKRLATGDFTVEERLTVSASIDGVSASGVNDVVVEKIDSHRLVSLQIAIDGRDFVTYRADGLIVATPTGSTAYSFSAGGPLMDPSVEALILTPVAAHSLFDRPMVLPASTEIELKVVSDRPVNVTVDKCDLGQMGEGEMTTITRGPTPAKFVMFGDRSFSGTLTEKFGLR